MVASAPRLPYLPVMDTVPNPQEDLAEHEPPEQRRHRLLWEAEAIAEAEAELAAGHGISQGDANAWLDSLDTDRPLPFPSRA